jgi:CRP/FNR family transcriptional regulator, cyclic AMP receptor protein
MGSLDRALFFRDAGIDLSNFEKRCTFRKYDENAVVIDFEDASADVYFILSGDVRVLVRTAAGKEIILGEMRAGQFFGELAQPM